MAPMRLEASSALAEATPQQGAANPYTAMYSKVYPDLGSINSVRKEVDDVLFDMKQYHKVEPDQIMSSVSAQSARMVEIIVQIQRIVITHKEWKPTLDEVGVVLAELKSQFSIASRAIAIRQMDWDMSGRGQT